MNLSEVLEQTHWYEQAGTPITQVPESDRTIISVIAAFYPILNGGFRYLFELDMICDVKADMLAEAYSRVGLHEHSDGISRVLSLFPESKLHEDLDERKNSCRSFLKKKMKMGTPMKTTLRSSTR